MRERNKFLTEAMGECWHDVRIGTLHGVLVNTCRNCGKRRKSDLSNPDFSTWEGFGKLWEWAQKNIPFGTFCELHSNGVDPDNMHIMAGFVNSDRFANAVYEFMKVQP